MERRIDFSIRLVANSSAAANGGGGGQGQGRGGNGGKVGMKNVGSDGGIGMSGDW